MTDAGGQPILSDPMSKNRPRKPPRPRDREPELFADLVDAKPDRPLPGKPDDDLVLDAEDLPAVAAESGASPAADAAFIDPTPEPVAVPAEIPSENPASAPLADNDWDLSARAEPVPPVEKQPESGAADQDTEFGTEPGEGDQRKRKERPSVQQTGNPVLDKVGKIVALVLLPVLLIGVFWIILSGKHAKGGSSMARTPRIPMEGNLLTIVEADSGWRNRTEADRVSSEKDVFTKESVYPQKLPEVKLKAAGTKTAYLRILFLNPERKIAGDPRVVKLVSGRVESAPSGVKLEGDAFTVTASSGLLHEERLRDYLASRETRWSIEVSESSDYQAKGDEWKTLGHFAVADKEL